MKSLNPGIVEISVPSNDMPVERILPNGARLLTRLTDNQLKRIKRVDKDYRLKQCSRLKLLTEKNKYIAFDSSLKLVNSRLAIDLVKQIRLMAAQRKKLNDLKREIIILDWGAGSGRALFEIFKELKLNNIINVKLIGFGDIPSNEWNKLPKGIDMILDVDWKLPLYFKKNSIDIIYSHLGLINMEARYYKMLYSLLQNKGVLIMDGKRSDVRFPEDNLQNNNCHPVYFLKKVSRKYQFLKKQVYYR